MLGKLSYQLIDNKYNLRFVFVFGAGEEHRIYLDEDGACIRYIDPSGVVYDNVVAQEQLDKHSDLTTYCTKGMLEIHWAFSNGF